MADDAYCLWVTQSPCMKPEIWAAWAQALMSALAIWAGARLANRQERRNLARKTDVYVNLISMADIQSQSIGTYTPSEVVDMAGGRSMLQHQIDVFEQFIAAFRSVALNDLPDYRLLPLIHDSADACGKIVDLLKVMKPGDFGSQSMLHMVGIRTSSHRLRVAYARAASIANEHQVTSIRQWLMRLRLKATAKKARG